MGLTDVSGEPNGPNLNGQERSDRLSGNVCKTLPFYAASKSQKNDELVYTAGENLKWRI